MSAFYVGFFNRIIDLTNDDYAQRYPYGTTVKLTNITEKQKYKRQKGLTSLVDIQIKNKENKKNRRKKGLTPRGRDCVDSEPLCPRARMF